MHTKTKINLKYLETLNKQDIEEKNKLNSMEYRNWK